MTTTHARVLTFNVRKSTIVEALPSRRWSARRANCISYLKKLGPWIIGLQEATVAQCQDIKTGLGGHWNYVGGVSAGNAVVMYDTLRFDMVPDSLVELTMDSGLRKRYATLVQLESRTSKEAAWFGSAHLAQGGPTEPSPDALRRQQIHTIGTKITGLPDNSRVVLCGDFNSATRKPTGAESIATPATLGQVRQIASQYYNLRCIRQKVRADVLGGESYDSSQHFKETLRTYRWIDDQLTGSGVRVVAASLRRTGPEIYRPAVSDHNGILTSLEY